MKQKIIDIIKTFFLVEFWPGRRSSSATIIPRPPKVPSFGEAATLFPPEGKKVEIELQPETRELESRLFDSLDASGKQRIRDSEVYYMSEKKIDHRPSWPETWMNVSRSIAQRSYDPRLKVGAIVVSEDNTRMLSVGYNGNYRGGPNEAESLEPGQSGMIHAEQNALVKCDFNFPKKKHMYLTHSPCRTCAKLIINAEITRVIYESEYRDQSGIDLLKSAGVEVYSLDEAILKA